MFKYYLHELRVPAGVLQSTLFSVRKKKLRKQKKCRFMEQPELSVPTSLIHSSFIGHFGSIFELSRWEDNIKMDLKKQDEGVNWIQLARNRLQWRALVNTVMNLRVP
jgi:hypothetical protein